MREPGKVGSVAPVCLTEPVLDDPIYRLSRADPCRSTQPRSTLNHVIGCDALQLDRDASGWRSWGIARLVLIGAPLDQTPWPSRASSADPPPREPQFRRNVRCMLHPSRPTCLPCECDTCVTESGDDHHSRHCSPDGLMSSSVRDSMH